MDIMAHRPSSKNQISKAALDLFIKKGIKATTTREIARKAGIAEGTIYRHFKSKNDIASELFLNYMTVFKERLSEAERRSNEPRESIKKMINAFFYFAKGEPKAYNYITAGHYSELAKMTSNLLKPKDVFVYAIKKGIAKGDFTKMDENLGAALVIGMITRSILFFNNGFIVKEYESMVSEVTKAALKVLSKERRI
ncbi:MAG: TetR/AcrR family transcriptional regulator [Thermodesulfobacteriota bacterium]